MTQLRLETPIRATPQTCFDLARNARLHIESAASTGERIVAGKNCGLWELDDEITFEARHLGFRQRMSARITRFEPPLLFVDEMTRGVFVSLRHTHRFLAQDGEITRMVDEIEWVSPLGFLGICADFFAVKPHLRAFLKRRATYLKTIAERK